MDYSSLLLSGALVLLVVLIVFYLAYLFNKLVRFGNAADANLGQVRVAMKKRLDMIEQLLGAVKGYIRHERGVFMEVTDMRTKIFEAGTQGLGDIDRETRSIGGGLIAVAEAYPELKANESVRKLMNAVFSVEDEVARHRYTYNNIVQQFNTMVDSIPSNLVARSAGFGKLDYLQFEEEVEVRPDIAGISES
ncbi:MAG: LemA family protein [Candidatus Bathyarchaeota archaeon]|nr:MAG: LemA family protein [Candidatus Bathyarchaeota archaeon]